MNPPKKASAFLRWFCREDYLEEIEGDLIEIFRKQCVGSPSKARWNFTWNVVKYFRPGFTKSFKDFYQPIPVVMYKSYIKTAWRNIAGKKIYAAINVSGLALGIACALVIFSITSYHLSFDKFHKDQDRIYRFVTEQHRDQVSYASSVPPAFGNTFRNDYAFGEKVANICTVTGRLITIQADGEAKKFREDISFAQPEFFEIFNFPIILGARNAQLREPNTAMITRKIARKYFGDESAIGKLLRFDNRMNFTVTGLLEDIPSNTDLRSEIYFSYSSIGEYNKWYAEPDAWGGITTDIQTFVRLQPGIKPAQVERVLPVYVKKYRAESKNVHHYKLQPVNDIHFNSKYGGKMDKATLWTLSIVGFLIILTACLNFINLATAQALTRAKEVGIRKVLGSARSQLFWQFTVETAVIVMMATLLSILVAYLVMPYVNELFSTRISFNLFSDYKLIFFSMLLIIAVIFLSGAYPSSILSGFNPITALRAKLKGQFKGGFNIRRALIVTQFTISQVLLIGLIVMLYQLKYFKDADMGFDRQAIVMIPTGSDKSRITILKTQFSTIAGVEKVSACFASPASDDQWGTSFKFDNRAEMEAFSVSVRNADENYLSTFDISLAAGRNLRGSDTAREFLVNEKMVARLGLTSAEAILNKQLSVNGNTWSGPIVGVVKDFHDQSFRSEIEPVFITTAKETYNSFAVKINMTNASSTLAALEKVWSSMYPDLIFQFDFLDDQIAEFYKAEEVMMTMSKVFAGIALFIVCMGLYGLVSFMAVQKTREIGIRKVLGGSISQMLWIFGKEFSVLVLVAFLVAAPIGWFLMSHWLSGYEYSVDFEAWIFVLELLIVFGVVLLTAGYRSLRAARANPVVSLRME